MPEPTPHASSLTTAAQGQADPLLQVQALSVRTAGARPYDILCPADLTLRSGDVLGLVGESGSGKTTLALALLGYARSGTRLHGSVRIDGQEIIAATEAARRATRGRLVSYVPQDPSTAMNPALRIGVQLSEVLAPSRSGRRRVDQSHVAELLEKVHLPTTRQFLARYPHQLSGGQLQRVSIVMAMVNRPRLIVFDEPTTGLDVTTQSRVLDTIRELIRDEQAAALYVTHDLTVVSSIANRIAVMYSGMLVEHASSSTALSRPAHPYARRLILATPDVAQRRELVGIPGVPLSPRDRSRDARSRPAASTPRTHAATRRRRRAPSRTSTWSAATGPSSCSARRCSRRRRPARPRGRSGLPTRKPCCPCRASAPSTAAPESCMTWTSRCARAPASRSSASPAAARRRSRAASAGCTRAP